MTAVVAKRGDETKFDGFSAAEGPDDATLALIEQLAEDDRVAAAKRKREREAADDSSFALAMKLEEEAEAERRKKARLAAAAASEGKAKGEVVFCPLGVVLLKGALGPDEQLGIVQTLLEMHGKPVEMAENSTTHVPLHMWNWPTKYSYYQIKDEGKLRKPEHLLQFGKGMYDKLAAAVLSARKLGLEEDKSLQSDLKFPMKYTPDALYSIVYPKNGTLHAHQDYGMGWVLGLSVGDACDFFFSKTATGPGRHTVRLESGDLILFNGQTLFHGVSKIYTGTAPKYWTSNKIIPKNVHRLNLQYRDRSTIQ